MSEDSSGEAELEAEPETSDPEDIRDLHPGALLCKASKARNLPVMAEALAHGADVNLVNDEDEGKTPLIQAVIGVSQWTEWYQVPVCGSRGATTKRHGRAGRFALSTFGAFYACMWKDRHIGLSLPFGVPHMHMEG